MPRRRVTQFLLGVGLVGVALWVVSLVFVGPTSHGGMTVGPLFVVAAVVGPLMIWWSLTRGTARIRDDTVRAFHGFALPLDILGAVDGDAFDYGYVIFMYGELFVKMTRDRGTVGADVSWLPRHGKPRNLGQYSLYNVLTVLDGGPPTGTPAMPLEQCAAIIANRYDAILEFLKRPDAGEQLEATERRRRDAMARYLRGSGASAPEAEP